MGPSWGYVGLSWPILGLCWPILRAIWPPLLGLCWPILGLCGGPILGLGWPILGLYWPILRPMLAHVDPSSATNSEKCEKMGTAKNTVKRRDFWWHGVPCRRHPHHTETLCQWRRDGACRLQLVVPNVAFWTHKKLAPTWLSRLPKRTPSPHWNTMAVKDGWRLRPAAARAPRRFLNPQERSSNMIAQASQNGPPRHTETPWQWRIDGACGLQLVVTNVAFCIHKKLAPTWLPSLPKRIPSPHWNTMAVKDGWRLRPAAGCA